jgi:hypothetical protein
VMATINVRICVHLCVCVCVFEQSSIS